MFKATVPDLNDEGIILVRGVPFGGPTERDIHGQFFSNRTNFLAHLLPLPPLFHFHGAKSGSLAEPVGETLAREQRRDGVYYRAKLAIDSTIDSVRQKAIQLWEAAKAGQLFASSGAVEATIKVADNGEILQWLVGELSLIDIRNNRENPASFHATVVPIKADLTAVETGDTTVDSLIIHGDTTELNDNQPTDNFFNELGSRMGLLYADQDRLQERMSLLFQQMRGTENIISTRSADMPDENDAILDRMQDQMAQMQTQMTELSTQNATLQTEIQARDDRITELQGQVSAKSAEVAMGLHAGLVETWIKDGKVTPAEKNHVLEVLSFAYQADMSTKGDVGFVNAVKRWVDARPTNPVFGSPSQVYTNLNGGGAVEGPGGAIDPVNIARLKRYAEIPEG